MATDVGFRCRKCGEWHEELPFSYHALAPAYWAKYLAEDAESELAEDQCVIRGEAYFVRGLVRLPVADMDGEFDWGVWASLSEQSFMRMSELWFQEGRESEPAAFGWLATELPVYDLSTLNLKTKVQTQELGLRPLIEVEPTDHPLSVEQREGITSARVQEFAERLLHSEP